MTQDKERIENSLPRNAEAQKLESEIAKNRSEQTKLELEAEEMRKRLRQKWYEGRLLIQAVVGGVVAAALMTTWFIGYFQPILRMDLESLRLENRIEAAENDLQRQENEQRTKALEQENESVRNKLVALSASNAELQDAQAQAEERAKTLQAKLERISSDFTALSTKHRLTESERARFAELAKNADAERQALAKEITTIGKARAETRVRSERIALQGILGLWDVYYNGMRNADQDKMLLDRGGQLQIHRVGRSSGIRTKTIQFFDAKLSGDTLTYRSKSYGETYKRELKIVDQDYMTGVSISDKRGKAKYEYRRVKRPLATKK